MLKSLKTSKRTWLLAITFILALTIVSIFPSTSPKPTPRPEWKTATEATYIVFIDGTKIYARNGQTGILDCSGTDASTIIQAAIDSIGQEGGTVWIKEGIYIIYHTIKIPSNITLTGAGYATKLVLADHADEEVIENKNQDAYVDQNIVITNLQIDGNGAKQTEGALASAIYFLKAQRSRVEGCWIHNIAKGATNAAIWLSTSSHNIIRGNMIYDNSYAGVYVGGTNNIISDNWFYNNHRGVYLANNYHIVKGNQVISGDEGIRMYLGASNNIVEGNLIKDNSEEGIIITHPGCKENLIHGNILINNNVQIIDDGTDTVIEDNVISTP